jgi:small subunit ribosomal protein S16
LLEVHETIGVAARPRVESALFFRPSADFFLRERSMVTIRLTRRGGRNQPFYHVVVTDSRKRQGGLSLEHVGFFNPIARKGEQKLRLELPRIDYWVGKGAQLSDRVRTLVTDYRKQATA